MQHGASAEKVEAALGDYKKNSLFSAREKLALELCERMTYSNKRVTDRFFNRVKKQFTEEELVELAAIVALERYGQSFGGRTHRLTMKGQGSRAKRQFWRGGTV